MGPLPCRSPILVLENTSGSTAPSGLAEAIAKRSLHEVVLQAHRRPPGDADSDSDRSLPAAWLDVREQFPAVCVGLVAEQGSGVANASRILAACGGGDPGPGAIALLGFHRVFAETCLSLMEDLEDAGRAGKTRFGHAAPRHVFEWPPIMILLPEDDPSLSDCARLCRRLRAMDVPVQLEVMRSVRRGRSDAALDELVGELDRFFATHLAPCFPTLL